MPWRVDEADPARRVAQERASCRQRFQYPGLAFYAQSACVPAALDHPFDQACRAVGIELIGHENQTR